MHFLQDVFQVAAIAFASVTNYHINGMHLFWHTLYEITKENMYKWLDKECDSLMSSQKITLDDLTYF